MKNKLTKSELAVAHAIRAAKEEALEYLAGESLITASWVFSTIINNVEKKLGKRDGFDFISFEQESSIEDE